MEEYKVLRILNIKKFQINRVEGGDTNIILKDMLKFDKNLSKKLCDSEDLIESIDIQVIRPGDYDRHINTIMDIIPISTKVLGKLGEGITHMLTGVYVMLTGATTGGKQMAEFGSSEGILKDKMIFDRAGTPSKDDYIIHFDVILKTGFEGDRKLTTVCHKVCDDFIQRFRNILKEMDGRYADEKYQYEDIVIKNKKKVLIIKQIAGQGFMYDNQLFPNEPSGFAGGKSIIDMHKLPIILSPNEYRDGAIRAMT